MNKKKLEKIWTKINNKFSFEQIRKETLNLAIKLINYESVKSNPLPHMPYGENCNIILNKVIDFFKNISNKIIESYIDPDGHYGYISINVNKSNDFVCFLCHLDTVPIDKKSNFSGATISDDSLFGRGAIDMKTSVAAIMVIIKHLLNNNWRPAHNLKIFFGLDEEYEFTGLKKFLKETKDNILFGYTPDAMFPIAYGEKGVIQFDVLEKFSCKYKVTGGKFYNSVCDEVIVKNCDEHIYKKCAEVLSPSDYIIKKDVSEMIILGNTAHSGIAYLGDNAAFKVIKVLIKTGINSNLFIFFDHVIKYDVFLSEMFNKSSQLNKELVLTLSKIHIDGNFLKLKILIRNGIKISISDIYTKFTDYFIKNNIQYSVVEKFDSYHNRIDQECVMVPHEIFSFFTNINRNPQLLPAATYAHEVPNIFPFGMASDYDNLSFHERNEHIKLSEINLGLKIYLMLFYTFI